MKKWRIKDISGDFNYGRGEHCSPVRYLKKLFFYRAFEWPKARQKSFKRIFSPCLGDANQRTACIGSFPLLKIFFRVHELVARAMRGKCVRHGAERKSAVLRSTRLHLYHACEHITRESRADSCTHCLHARWKRVAGVAVVRALTGWSVYILWLERLRLIRN